MFNPHLTVLLARLRWPVPAVKWWVSQQLALLLLDIQQREAVQAALLDALLQARFETEAVEFLFVFWLASTRDQSYQCPAELGAHVKARSPLSDLILRSLDSRCEYFGEYLAPLLRFPGGTAKPRDFLVAEGYTFPNILRSVLRRIEMRTRLPLQAQFASEWQASLSRTPAHNHNIDFFLDSPRNQHTGQFFTQQSARARSAFLRTLSVAKEHGLPEPFVESFSLSTLPLDPVLAWLQPNPPVNALALYESGHIEASVDEYIRAVLGQVNQGRVAGALSWPVELDTNTWLDITVVLWSGSARQLHENLIPENSFNVVGGFKSPGLETLARCEYFHEAASITAGTEARPLAGWIQPAQYGYMQADLINRHVFAPIPVDQATEVEVAPEGGTLIFRSGSFQLATFGYWNTKWRASHLRDAGPRCGTYLLLSADYEFPQWGESPSHLFYAWRCRRFTRESDFGSVRYTDTVGVLPWS